MAAVAAAAAAPEPWNAVAPRKKRPAGRRPRRDEGRARGPRAEPEADGEAVRRRLREAEEDLRISDFCSSALETITQCLRKQLEQLQGLTEALGRLCLGSSPGGSGEPLATSTCPVKCVCYGLGNFASCVTARTQLAFMLLFLEKCQIPRSRCWVYDPLFSQAEVSVLASLGVTVLSENEEGKHSVQGQPTVFYMPHCGTALYNNLLWSNWSVDALSRMVIIGNSFRGLEERLLSRILQKNYAYIEKILRGLEELPLPQTPQYMDTFNDISVHWFPHLKLERLPRDLWASQEEPDYQDCEDLEIIRKQTDELSWCSGQYLPPGPGAMVQTMPSPVPGQEYSPAGEITSHPALVAWSPK
ncbi:LOW QUALITY PROTEIN: SRR1-like protein [Peromyscus californicus insignis]|uniref:LOW QUALITY PROTEIN: SRR1-like protein n=1 Tax=Peromyscus californicus insignis TaxID=564181 RepID=UPI0022A6C862|nr:LOW QUALITY PROTEIN: SRR1-like protein [Peromyscus californicus insignis]